MHGDLDLDICYWDSRRDREAQKSLLLSKNYIYTFAT